MRRTTKTVIRAFLDALGNNVSPEQMERIKENIGTLCIDKAENKRFQTLPTGSIVMKHMYQSHQFIGSHVLIWIRRDDIPLKSNLPESSMFNSLGVFAHITATSGTLQIHSVEHIVTIYNQEPTDYDLVAYPCTDHAYGQALGNIVCASLHIPNYQPQPEDTDPQTPVYAQKPATWITLASDTVYSPIRGHMDCQQFVFACLQRAGKAIQHKQKVNLTQAEKALPTVNAGTLHLDLLANRHYSAPSKCQRVTPSFSDLQKQKRIIDHYRQSQATKETNLNRHTTCVIQGLTSQRGERLNGETCRIIGYRPDTGRYTVILLNTQKIVSLQAGNLQAITKHKPQAKTAFYKPDLFFIVALAAMAYFAYHLFAIVMQHALATPDATHPAIFPHNQARAFAPTLGGEPQSNLENNAPDEPNPGYHQGL